MAQQAPRNHQQIPATIDNATFQATPLATKTAITVPNANGNFQFNGMFHHITQEIQQAQYALTPE